MQVFYEKEEVLENLGQTLSILWPSKGGSEVGHAFVQMREGQPLLGRPYTTGAPLKSPMGNYSAAFDTCFALFLTLLKD